MSEHIMKLIHAFLGFLSSLGSSPADLHSGIAEHFTQSRDWSLKPRRKLFHALFQTCSDCRKCGEAINLGDPDERYDDIRDSIKSLEKSVDIVRSISADYPEELREFRISNEGKPSITDLTDPWNDFKWRKWAKYCKEGCSPHKNGSRDWEALDIRKVRPLYEMTKDTANELYYSVRDRLPRKFWYEMEED